MNSLFKAQIVNKLDSLGFTRKTLELKKILDKSYKVIKGTINDKPDRDTAWLFALSRRFKNIFDIGANIGQSSMLMLYNDPDNIVLVDPNPRALSLAAENLIMNSLSQKARFINAFISDKDGETIDFYTVGGGAAGSKFRGMAQTARKLNSHFNVITMTVDHIVQETGISPQLIKVDVEGAEIDVLNGAGKLASKGEAVFFVEIHSGEELNIVDNTSQILNWCTKNGYAAWYLKNKTPLDADSIKSRGRYHALLMPMNTTFPEYLLDINEGDDLRI